MLCAFVADRRRPVQPSPDIRALDSLGRDLIERAYADSTRRNLNSHIKIYLTFCEAVSSAPFPVTVKLITRYIVYLVSLGRVYGTILNHLSSNFLRKSNLVVDRAAQVSPKVLLRSDLCFDASFAYLTVRTSKTIQFQERLFSLPLPRIPGRLLCPVATLVNHLRINQVPQDMPLFSVRSDSSLSHITYTLKYHLS